MVFIGMICRVLVTADNAKMPEFVHMLCAAQNLSLACCASLQSQGHAKFLNLETKLSLTEGPAIAGLQFWKSSNSQQHNSSRRCFKLEGSTCCSLKQASCNSLPPPFVFGWAVLLVPSGLSFESETGTCSCQTFQVEMTVTVTLMISNCYRSKCCFIIHTVASAH